MSFKAPVSLRRRLALQFGRIPLVGHRPFERYLRRKYGARVVTPLKARNFLAVQRDLLRGAVETSSLPYILNLDLFNGCNLKCPFCATGTSQHEREKARLPLERALRVIDLVSDHTLEVRFYNWGEPLLNPEVFQAVAHARERGLYTIINSNLSVRVERLAEKVVESGLDVLQVSLDGLHQATLQIYRRRADCALVFENIAAIAKERSRRGVTHPRIDVAFLVFRHNEHELSELESRRREVGADRIFPRRAFIYDREWVPRHPDFPPMQAIFHERCDYLYNELTVEATGAISPCCANTSSSWDVGMIEDIEDLPRFWNSPRMRAMRAFDPGRPEASDPSVLCRHCSFVGREDASGSELSPRPPAFVASGVRYETGTPEWTSKIAR